MQLIFGLICDGGDGSGHLVWFRDPDLVHKLLESEKHEVFWMNEGVPDQALALPDGLDLEAAGFRFGDNYDWNFNE